MNQGITIESIKNKIHTIRGLQVILDKDLAKFYEVGTKRLNEQVKRNIERFPHSFMFQLTKEEKNYLVANCDHLNSLKFSSNLPYVFTEQGVSMLSSILHSKKAVQVSIQVINAFVEMKKFLNQNQDFFQRLNIVETKILEYDNNFNTIFKFLENQKPQKGIFYEGQLFDAYEFITNLIRNAKNKIILIDNYVDERTLKLFNKRDEEVNVVIYTKNITEELSEDLKKYNSQYKPIKIKPFSLSHDRFLIIDNDLYHIGCSLKDTVTHFIRSVQFLSKLKNSLGKKWTAFSKMNDFREEITKRLKTTSHKFQ